MKNTLALLLSFFFISFTLASCEDNWDLEPSCSSCGNSNGGMATIIFDRLSDAPENEEFHSDKGYLIQDGQKWADFNDHILAANGNYVDLKLVPVIQADGLPRTNQLGEQFYRIESYDYKP